MLLVFGQSSFLRACLLNLIFGWIIVAHRMNDRIYVEMIFFFSFIIIVFCVVLKQNMPGIGERKKEKGKKTCFS